MELTEPYSGTNEFQIMEQVKEGKVKELKSVRSKELLELYNYMKQKVYIFFFLFNLIFLFYFIYLFISQYQLNFIKL
jgi:hypothetical protein